MFEYLSSFAESNNPVALNSLSECYYFGLGVEKDYSVCFALDSRAATTNAPDALAVLGLDYKCGIGVDIDIERAISLYRQAVAMGSAKGMTYLGICYEDGTGLDKDEVRAFELYRQAAATGFARAQRLLGLCYENGIGTVVDEEKAVYWYKKAAEQDNPVAQRYLGLCYENGTGTAVDKEKAVYWYKKSAEQDNTIAQRWLAMCYEHGDGVEKDIEKAIEWYLRAITNDDDISRVNLACIYNDQFDDEEKDKLALEYFLKAEQYLAKDCYHYYIVCYKLAEYYERGYLVERDEYKTFEYIKIAAEGGIETAIVTLADYYERGFGTTEDKQKSIEWYEKGAEFITDNIDKAECHLLIGDMASYFDTEEMKIREKNNYDLARSIYLEEANKGNADALLQIGLMLCNGKGVEKDESRAFEYIERASLKLQDGEAIFWLANCYLRGMGIAKDERKGFDLLFDASQRKNHVASMLLMCYCYISGIGVKTNPQKAKELMLKLQENYSEIDYVPSYIHLYHGIMYYHGIGEKMDKKLAEEHFNKSTGVGSILYAPLCRGDYTKANLLGLIFSGNLLSTSVPILNDKKRAKYFLELAYENEAIGDTGIYKLCRFLYEENEHERAYHILSTQKSDQQNPEIDRLLGQHYYYGCGVKKDINAAFRHFDNAYEIGDDIAKVYLASCYAYGKGVEQNLDMARNIIENTSLSNGNVSKVLRGLLIYSGAWGYKKDKEHGLSLIDEGAKIPRYKLYYDYLSTLRGDYYVDLFIDVFWICLHIDFDKSKKAKLILPQIIRLIFLLIAKRPDSTNLSKKEMLRILLSQNQAIIEQNQEQQESRAELSSVLSQIKTNTDTIPQIIEQQEEITNALRSIIEYVMEQKDNIPDESGLKFLDEEQLEQIHARFVEETAKKIVTSLQDSTVSVEREEAMLKGMFGDHWAKLDSYTRKSLLSARVLFNNCKSPAFASLDHSGVVVSATSALENELKRRLFIGYQTFVKKKLGPVDSGQWPEILVFRNKKGDLIASKSFTLGSLPYLFDTSDDDKKLL